MDPNHYSGSSHDADPAPPLQNAVFPFPETVVLIETSQKHLFKAG